MKKTPAVFFCFVMMILLIGCNWVYDRKSETENTSSDSAIVDNRGKTLDFPIPKGEYIDICPGEGDVQLCVLDIVDDPNSSDRFIVKFHIKAVSLNGKTFSPTTSLFEIMDNGTMQQYAIDPFLEKEVNLSELPDITFITEGETDCGADFIGNPDDCRCLRYEDGKGDVFYFAIR